VESAREANSADVAVLAGLWESAMAELDGQRGGFLLAGSLIRSDLPATLHEALNDPDRLLVVGLIDDVPVGFAAADCDRNRREPLCQIQVIYVEPNARQVGVAEAVLQLVMAWAESKGCVGVDAPALPGNRPAKAFFEGQGFLARLLVMHHAVPPVGGPPVSKSHD
jgi:GNAT superfamily N-acetyltransferase